MARTGIIKHRAEGNPDRAHFSMSSVERQNPTLQMSVSRLTALTNVFSKRVENHTHALALYVTFYNFMRMHKKFRCIPAMAVALTDRLWSMENVVALIDALADGPQARGAYNRRQPKAA